MYHKWGLPLLVIVVTVCVINGQLRCLPDQQPLTSFQPLPYFSYGEPSPPHSQLNSSIGVGSTPGSRDRGVNQAQLMRVA